MIKISKVFEKYFDLRENILFCVFFISIYFYFCFSLFNSSGEARPHLPPLTARPCHGTCGFRAFGKNERSSTPSAVFKTLLELQGHEHYDPQKKNYIFLRNCSEEMKPRSKK